MASARHIPGIMDSRKGDAEKSRIVRKHLTREEFGRRLADAMSDKGWNQAELARAAGVLRDSVSNYIRGNILPEPKNLAKLAHALGVTPDDLLPNYSEQAIETDINPPLEIKTSSENPDMSILRINRIVKTAGIPAILEALERAK